MKNPIRVFLKRVFNSLMEGVLDVESRNISRARQNLALQQTVAFIEKNLPGIIFFEDRYSLIKHIIQFIPNTQDGLICEFGVAGGKSLNFLASLMPDRTLHGFDSFKGLPEDWGAILPKGAFKQPSPEVASHVHLHKGWFSDSLPQFLENYKGRVDFLNIDCDLYSSTKTVFDLIGDRIQSGTVIYFDDYFNFPGWQEYEYKAFEEFADAKKLKYDYLGYNCLGKQLAIQIK